MTPLALLQIAAAPGYKYLARGISSIAKKNAQPRSHALIVVSQREPQAPWHRPVIELLNRCQNTRRHRVPVALVRRVQSRARYLAVRVRTPNPSRVWPSHPAKHHRSRWRTAFPIRAAGNKQNRRLGPSAAATPPYPRRPKLFCSAATAPQIPRSRSFCFGFRQRAVRETSPESLRLLPYESGRHADSLL